MLDATVARRLRIWCEEESLKVDKAIAATTSRTAAWRLMLLENQDRLKDILHVLDVAEQVDGQYPEDMKALEAELEETQIDLEECREELNALRSKDN